MKSTPLYYATVSGVMSGLAFPIGDEWYFTPTDDPRVYKVAGLGVLTMNAEVEGLMAEELTRTVIEPRLRAMTGGKAA